MNKKLLIGIGVVAIIAVVVIIAVVIGGKGNNDNKTSLSIEELNTKISEQTPFNEMAMQEVSNEELTSYFQVDVSNVEKVEGKIPLMNVQASMYLLIEAKEGKVQDVKTQVEAFCTSYEEQWSRYLPEQHELVQNRKVGTVGNLVYLIIAENAETLEAMTK